MVYSIRNKGINAFVFYLIQMPEKDNFKVITISIVAPGHKSDEIKDDLLEHITGNRVGIFILSSEIRELESHEWEEVQSEVSPDVLNEVEDIDFLEE